MRSILLHIHDDDCLEARLQVALDLARAFDGHVTCLQALPFEFGVPGDLYGTMAVQLLPEIRESGDALRARLQNRLASEDVAWNWIQEDGLDADQLLRRCGLSDIVVLGSYDPFGKGPAMLAGDMALRARMPVMIVPPETKRFDCDGPAIVAWDGSPEALAHSGARSPCWRNRAPSCWRPYWANAMARTPICPRRRARNTFRATVSVAK